MTDIAELFRRDPLQLSREEIGTIVARMREARGQFNMGNAQAGRTKPPSEKQQKLLDLSDKLNVKIEL